MILEQKIVQLYEFKACFASGSMSGTWFILFLCIDVAKGTPSLHCKETVFTCSSLKTSTSPFLLQG